MMFVDGTVPSLQDYLLRFWPVLLAVGITLVVRRLFAVPSELSHLPRVPVLPTIWSYVSGESDDTRFKNIVLPFANTYGEGVVLVFAFDRWMLHVLDSKIAKEIFDNNERFPKAAPPEGLFIWKLIGLNNIVVSNGEAWKRLSRVVKAAVNRNVPLEDFSRIARQLFDVMESGGVMCWDNLMMRYALDAIGTTSLGHFFNALGDPNSPFVSQYNHVMESIADPFYLFLPSLVKVFPRPQTLQGIKDVVAQFQLLLEHKKENKGNDMLTYMLEEPGITDIEHRDNIISFFIGGHDTTAGAMCTLTYYLAKHPELQQRAREEVMNAMKCSETGDPTMDELRKMPFIHACVREALRLNAPIAYLTPREAIESLTFTSRSTKAGMPLKSYVVPKGTSIIVNLTCIHFNEFYWPEATLFKPERFLDLKSTDSAAWLPFAAGARQCPARNFAMYELRTLSSMLLREWEWDLPTDSPHTKSIKNGFSPFALSLPKELFVKFNRRQTLSTFEKGGDDL